MEITEIKKIGKGNRYHLYSDSGYIGIFEAEILAKYKLKTGQDIDKESLEKIKIENGDLASFDRALSYLEKGMKTEKGIRDYLLSKTFPEECVERAIEKLTEYGYINDRTYAENYVRSYSKTKGRKKLKYELLSKGVDGEIIEEVLSENLNDDEEKETCLALTKKYLKNRELDIKLKQKLYSHLVSKGFGFDVVSSVVREVENGGN